MNEILKKRIEEAANDRYTDNTFAYKGFIDGAEYALSHQWISVEEALPEYDEAVIVRNCNGEISSATVQIELELRQMMINGVTIRMRRLSHGCLRLNLKRKSSEYGI